MTLLKVIVSYSTSDMRSGIGGITTEFRLFQWSTTLSSESTPLGNCQYWIALLL